MNGQQERKVYDLVIIGAGPAGLALAQCLRNTKMSIAIVEKEKMVGGCHRVRRVDGLFTEHGPRVYSTTYTVFRSLLEDMNVSFTDLFAKYHFTIGEIGGETIFSTLSLNELSILSIEFFKLMFYDNTGRDVMMLDFLKKNGFQEESIEMIDRLCKLTDGGGVDKYTLNQFLQLANQQFFYPLYQPKKPNDKSLFAIWKTFLEKNNVDFYLDSEVGDVTANRSGEIESVSIKNNSVSYLSKLRIYGKRFVFAIPPKTLNNLIKYNNLAHNWGNLDKYAKETAYIDYISVSFHWDTKLDLKKVYGFPKSDWGVAFVVLSDYMKFDEKESQTVISSAITITDKISKNNGKTADQCDENEMISELLHQLREAYPQLPEPTNIVMSPDVYYSETLKKWIAGDTAFITTANKGYLPFKNEVINNMYTLGTHNGKSLYRFTSLESAVSNAVVLARELGGDSVTIGLSRSVYVSDIVRIILVFVIAYFILRRLSRK